MRAVMILAASAISLPLSVYANATLAGTQDQLKNTRVNEPGFSGYLQLLAGGYNSKGLVNIGDDSERITSLDAKSERSEESFIVPLWQVRYLLPQTSTTLNLGTPDHSAFQSGVAFEAGISHELADGTILSVSYIPKISGFRDEVWQDPYLTGQKRKRSDTSIEAFYFAAENIFDTGLSFSHSFGEQFVDDDHAGESLSSRLTAGERKQLQRDGKFHSSHLSLTLPFADYFYLIPGASYIRTDAKGEANSHDSLGANLTFAFQQGQFEIFIDGYFNKTDYDKPNPVFNIKREEVSYGVTAGVSYLKPLGWDDIKLDLIVGEARRQDSEIHFFETKEEFLALGITYEY